MSLYQALDIFEDNLQDILDACTDNVLDSIERIKKEDQHLGTSWVAQEVHKMNIERECGEQLRAIRAIQRRMSSTDTSRISQDDIARAKEHPIQDMYQGKLKRATGKYALKGTCPFHKENTASFLIDKKNRYKCFGCGEYGDAISFHMKTTGSTFINSVKALL